MSVGYVLKRRRSSRRASSY